MSTPPAPARVFGFVAAEADVCVLLRRGPSKWVLMVRWDLATDEFEIGQWLSDRVYERRSDLSVDGKLFVYQALNSKWGTERGGAYSAVCRPPYFTALAFWEQGTNGPYFQWVRRLQLASRVPTPTKGTLPRQIATRLRESGPAYTVPGWRRPGVGKVHLIVRDTRFGRLEWRVSTYKDRGGYALDERPLDVDWADVDHRGRL
ncbi:hypothetical protein EON79_22440, partial [bacterium]